MDPIHDYLLQQTRRQFFGTSGVRLGGAALGLLAASARGAAPVSKSPAKPPAERVQPPLKGLPHFAPRAKSIIYLHMNGGPSQIDTWDYKPELHKQFDKDLPDSIRKGQRITTMTSGQARLPVAPSMFKFAQHGKCGRWVSELLPHTAKHVDDIALIKTVFTNAINHDPACTFVMSGREVPGFASLGSWVSYGLGAETNDLPAFVVLTPNWKSKAAAQALFTRMWSSGFLPTAHTGVALRSVGDPVLYIQNPPGVDARHRRVMLDALVELNETSKARFGDPEIDTRIKQYEMAFRMQSSVPELTDLSRETAATLEMYGPDVTKPGTFASSALMARRLVERGVRVVQILHRGWDQHGNLPGDLRLQCEDTDQPIGALLTDLKQKGLLDETLVVWGGEFGRTVYSQGTLTATNYGRDHHPKNFCMWLAGGGIKGGQTLGETDDFSYNVVDKPTHVNDLNATILHCLGIDHERLSYKFQGLDARLTGVEPQHPLKELLA
ncbi:MAG: DUF1501 domain-containing protein [Planctomycetes bacterium]|nr:DUF1501 domain-containing protein [Planctomycetota bacterium]